MRKLIALAVLPLALAACDLSAEAEADTVCVLQPLTDPPTTLPGAPAGSPVVDLPQIPGQFAFRLGDAVPDLTEEGVTADLVARSIALTTTEGNVDLAGIERVTFTLVGPPGSGLPDVFFEYARPGGAGAPVFEAAALPDRAADLADYLVGQSTVAIRAVAVRGRPPTVPWTPAARLCFGSRVEIDYLKPAAR